MGKSKDFVTVGEGASAHAIPREWIQESDWDKEERDKALAKAEAFTRNYDLSENEVLAKFISEDDYTNSDDYKKLEKENSDIVDRRHELSDELNQLRKQLKEEARPKPRSEWTTSDEISNLIGDTPMSYTEAGKKLQGQIAHLTEEYRKADSRFTVLNDKLHTIDTKYAAKEKSWWNKNRPAYKKGNANKDYIGFATKTRSGYDKDLEQGKGFIAEMSPKEYLQRISYDVFESTWSHTVSGVFPKNIIKYMIMMQEGIKFDMPSIIEGSAQEGRHRAMAAYLLGIEKIPVYVRRK